MSEIEVIQTALKRTERRRRWQRAWQGFWSGFLVGAATWLVALVIYKLLPIPPVTLQALAWLWFGLALAGGIAGGWKRLTPAQTARWVDEREHFQERLSTALEVSREPTSGRWGELVLADAAGRAQGYDPGRTMPFRLPRLARWAAVVVALTAGLGFVPEYRSQAHRQKQKEAQVIREVGQQLVDLTKRQLENRLPALESTQQALDSVRDLGSQLTNAKLNRTDALKGLASVTDRVKEQTRELARDPALRRLREHARTPSGSSGNTPEALQKQVESLQEQLGQQAGKADALERMKQELGKIQEAAAGLPDGNQAASQAAKEQLSQAMSNLAKQADELGVDLPGLEEAIKALEGAQIDRMALMQDLDLAAMDLEKMVQMAKALKNLQAQLADLGKTLAEQLDKGQAMAAVASLNRMMRQLESANLTPEQLDKLRQEVDDAIQPGSEYGRVGEHLKQATQQLRQGAKGEASKSLANAAEELKKLMEQMGDCESLLAALDGLKTAQMCVGNGLGWGLAKGKGRPRFGPGGRPGSGVGTWGDDSLWMDPEDSGLWDNTGIEQPDIDARGHTDRGEGEVSDALTPTRVKGQITPGTPMPSIQLRGVSIKGQSKVSYTEAVAAAQSDAQSALNQDEVPRAYQGAVKNYFDDLQE